MATFTITLAGHAAELTIAWDGENWIAPTSGNGDGTARSALEWEIDSWLKTLMSSGAVEAAKDLAEDYIDSHTCEQLEAAEDEVRRNSGKITSPICENIDGDNTHVKFTDANGVVVEGLISNADQVDQGEWNFEATINGSPARVRLIDFGDGEAEWFLA